MRESGLTPYQTCSSGVTYSDLSLGSPRANALNELCASEFRISTSLLGCPRATVLKHTCSESRIVLSVYGDHGLPPYTKRAFMYRTPCQGVRGLMP